MGVASEGIAVTVMGKLAYPWALPRKPAPAVRLFDGLFENNIVTFSYVHMK